jgi:peptidoglycan/LPS O-acetylase OafA/YrhL
VNQCDLRGSAAGQFQTGRILELDSLRGLAALAVVIFHTNSSWLPFGWAAVDLFFVLSGYLITAIILSHGDSPGFLGRFYVRRGLRTWPVYYLVIAAICLASPLLKRPCLWSSLPFTLTYTQGLGRIWSTANEPFSPYLAHTWSLAIEEQFYVFWPALLLLVGRRYIVPLAIVCVACSVIARSQGVWWDLCSRSDGLILGGLLAAARADRGKSASSRSVYSVFSTAIPLGAAAAFIYLGALALSAGIQPDVLLPSHPASTLLAFNLLWLGVIHAVLERSESRSIRLLRLPPLVHLGQASYGLYLYHFPVLAILLEITRELGFMGKVYPVRIVSIGLSIVLAGLSWRFVEQPILMLKSRFAYRARRTISGLPASQPFHQIGAVPQSKLAGDAATWSFTRSGGLTGQVERARRGRSFRLRKIRHDGKPGKSLRKLILLPHLRMVSAETGPKPDIRLPFLVSDGQVGEL